MAIAPLGRVRAATRARPARRTRARVRGRDAPAAAAPRWAPQAAASRPRGASAACRSQAAHTVCVSASGHRGSARVAPETPMPAPTRGSRRRKTRRRAAARRPWRAALSPQGEHGGCRSKAEARAARSTRCWSQRGRDRGEERAKFRADGSENERRFCATAGKTLAGQAACCYTHAHVTARACPHHPGLDAHAAAPTRACPCGAHMQAAWA